MTSALIIGAGPAGLTAAYELGKLGGRATVIESDDVVGGLSRTVCHRGYRFDIGGHRFFSKVSLINELCREILGDDLLLRPRLSRIYYRDRFFDYPLKPVNAMLGLGPVETGRVALSYAKARVTPSTEETNLEQWVSNRFGWRLYEIFFKTYTEKVWGIPCSEISADWAAQRIKNLSLAEAVRAALPGRKHDGDIITSLIEQFHYPRLGPGMMWERCAERVADQGGDVVLGLRAVRVRHAHGRVFAVECRRQDGERVELTAENFISTMAVRDLVEAMDPLPPEDVRRAAQSLNYRDYLAVALVVNRENVFPDNWIYIHAPEVRLGRIQNYKNWSPEMVPDPSRTSLGLEYFLWETDPQWSWPAEKLIEEGIEDCARIGILSRDEVEDGTVVRVRKAYPVYDHAYRDHLAVIRRWLATIANLQLVGRNGQHRYNNQDHSMLAGIYAARNLTGAQYDVWAVNTEAEYHEQAAPEDRMVPARLTATIPADEDAVVARVLARLDPVALGTAFAAVGGLALFVASAVLVLKGGPLVGPNLALIGEYLPGFRVTWSGAFVGLIEASLGGFGLGYGTAWLRNRTLLAFAERLQRRAAAKLEGQMLDEL